MKNGLEPLTRGWGLVRGLKFKKFSLQVSGTEHHTWQSVTPGSLLGRHGWLKRTGNVDRDYLFRHLTMAIPGLQYHAMLGGYNY
jgi:hypothetical protein